MAASSQAYMVAMERERLRDLLAGSVELERLKAENRDLLHALNLAMLWVDHGEKELGYETAVGRICRDCILKTEGTMP